MRQSLSERASLIRASSLDEGTGQQVWQTFDETCTHIAGGQSTRVRSDGSYLLQNIPVGDGLLRVEASCVQDGVTLYGATLFRPLANGQTVEFGSVPLSPEPIPTVASIRANYPATFTEIGETGQIVVIALLSDGTSEDVTSQTRGSAYTRATRTSCPAPSGQARSAVAIALSLRLRAWPRGSASARLGGRLRRAR